MKFDAAKYDKERCVIQVWYLVGEERNLIEVKEDEFRKQFRGKISPDNYKPEVGRDRYAVCVEGNWKQFRKLYL
ncbi:hypothetical protein IWQ55_006588 [Labrenzia sp. EL_208]|nr:hypothetical protein [Labrenzia sp. EL_132]MBG6233346.1 hypothetical protein [Labrenzia sp. EL_208]